METSIKNICVYCGSSTQVSPAYLRAAFQLGEILAKNNLRLIYGGGSLGLMGEIAKGVLSAGGEVTGVIPRFMYEENWYYPELKDLNIVESMHERKLKMAELADAFIALPGGCGTMEELLEIITWKQLGLTIKPIVIANLNNYYSPLIELFNRSVEEQFMREKHLEMWSVVDCIEDILPTIHSSEVWDASFRKIARI
ncbi:TIGR00730 family Rossman fold protein [Paludibacteraceae bacterium OttesenSCG-928-F17]|nr:TIGR00730 family Rossman fold protein [Paludibacteraceae bacterium OttesenSCG-928-F17]